MALLSQTGSGDSGGFCGGVHTPVHTSEIGREP
jgi:hypothetical protein